jgi:hypothetical protein
MKHNNERDSRQSWFWTREWQRGEREAEADIQARRLSGPFKTLNELMEHLSNKSENHRARRGQQ